MQNLEFRAKAVQTELAIGPNSNENHFLSELYRLLVLHRD